MIKKENTLVYLMMEAIEKILKYAEGFTSPHELVRDSKTFDACMVNFIVLGESVDKLSNKFKGEFSHIDWDSVQSLRNVLTYDSVGMLPEEAWLMIRHRLPALYEELKKV